MDRQEWAAQPPAGAADAAATNVPVPQLPGTDDDGGPPKKKRKSPAKPTVPRQLLKTVGNESDRLATTQSLLEASSRVDGAVCELIKYCDLLSDPSGANEDKRREAIQNIRESILPMLHVASCTLRDTGMSFAPFGGLRALHNRNEAQRKQAVVDKSSDKSLALQMMDDYVHRSSVEIPTHIAELSSRSETAVLEQNVDDEYGKAKTIRIIRPQNGTLYTRSEALRVAKMYRKGSRERGLAVRAMVAKGWAGASTKTIYRMVQADEEGHPIVDEGWRTNGRPANAKVDEAKLRAISAQPLGAPSPGDYVDVTIFKRKKGGKRKQPVGGGMLDLDPNEGISLGEVKSVKQSAAKPPAKKKSPPQPAKKTPKKSEEEEYDENVRNFPLPEPADGGNVYKKSEAVRIARQYQRGSQERRWAIKAMRYKGFVPNSMKTLYRLIQKDEKGLEIVDSPWSRPGCPALLSNDDVDAIVDRIRAGNVRLFGKEDVERLIVDFVREKRAKQGQDPCENPVRFNVTTLKNYETLFRSKLPSVYWKEG